MTIEVVLAVLASGVLTAFITGWFNRWRNRTQATAHLAEAYTKLTADLTADNKVLRAEVVGLNKRVRCLEQKLDKALTALRDNNISIDEAA
ncbi:hypothetical protein [Hoyosella altamirensis]|uniref:Uncharacterized protein n=1 Tax=Hoyosella altamirensis TaxID=616997 RepID=A0A839RUY9_9ACTN|nr:hypothetical protein [Hoyosella altamirensis]MBB3040127.1 hypothetical protein [Hoyosella altamirensis]